MPKRAPKKVLCKIRQGLSNYPVAAYVLLVLAIALSFARIEVIRRGNIDKLARADYQQCFRTYTLLTQLILPGLQNLDKQAYYKTHPYEKELVRGQIKDALRKSNPAQCKHLPSQHLQGS